MTAATTTTVVSSHWFQILILLAALTTPHYRHRRRHHHQQRLWLAALGKTTTTATDYYEPTEQALFGMGSFWNTVFSRQPGVLRITAVYAATGTRPSFPASYLSVCAGDGRTEAILVEFLPSQTSYEQLLQVFWNHATIPPFTEQKHHQQQTRSQYQSVLWPLTDHQRLVAEQSLEQQQLQEDLDRIVSTRIAPASTTATDFTVAESMHQNFWFKLRLKLACLVAGIVASRRARLMTMTHMALETVLLWILWEGLEICVKGLVSAVGGCRVVF